MKRLEALSDQHAYSVKLSRFLVREGAYVAKVTSIDHDVLLDAAARRRKAEEMLAFITDQLDPAHDDRVSALKLQPGDAARAEITRIGLAQAHRRLSWETSLAAEKDGEKTDHPAKWTSLAEKYEADDDTANAAGALSNGLERLIEVSERAQRRSVLDGTEGLLEQLGAMLDRVPNEMELEIRKVLARAHLTRGEKESATKEVVAAVDVIEQALSEAGEDRFRRAFLLRDCDDWLGLAAAADPESTLRFRGKLRRDCSPIPTDHAQDLVIYPILGRQRGGLLVWHAGELKFTQVTAAHDLAMVIDALHRHANRDIGQYKAGNDTEAKWRELLMKLAGMLRLHEVTALMKDAHVLFVLEGASVRVPWPALLLAAGAAPASIELRITSTPPFTRLSGESMVDGCVTTNAFRGKPTAEQWHQAISKIAGILGGACHDWANLPATPALHDLAVVGAHGSRRSFEALTVTVGDKATRLRAVEFVERIPVGRTTFCAVCFAGGGFLSGEGHWESMPALLLARGADRVLANVWPAWDLPTKRGALATLLEEISKAPSNRDAAKALMAWQEEERIEHPRWWSGWGLWTYLPPEPQ
ncbi:MAG: hypothetical protein R3B13_31425 [Polyangiaceae bacterium]